MAQPIPGPSRSSGAAGSVWSRGPPAAAAAKPLAPKPSVDRAEHDPSPSQPHSAPFPAQSTQGASTPAAPASAVLPASEPPATPPPITEPTLSSRPSPHTPLSFSSVSALRLSPTSPPQPPDVSAATTSTRSPATATLTFARHLQGKAGLPPDAVIQSRPSQRQKRLHTQRPAASSSSAGIKYDAEASPAAFMPSSPLPRSVSVSGALEKPPQSTELDLVPPPPPPPPLSPPTPVQASPIHASPLPSPATPSSNVEKRSKPKAWADLFRNKSPSGSAGSSPSVANASLGGPSVPSKLASAGADISFGTSRSASVSSLPQATPPLTNGTAPTANGNGTAPAPSPSTKTEALERPILLSELLLGVEYNFEAPYLHPRGLVNNGNICFANAILQVLVHCAPFYNLLRIVGTHTVHDFASRTPLLDAMLAFSSSFLAVEKSALEPVPASETWVEAGRSGKGRREHRVQSGRAPSPPPSGPVDGVVATELRYRVPPPPLGGPRAGQGWTDPFVAESVWAATKGNKRFDAVRRGQQEDAQEFLGFFLDTLHEELLLAIDRHDSAIRAKFPEASEAENVTPGPAALEGGVGSLGSRDTVVESTEDEGWMEVGSKGKTAVTRSTESASSAITKIFDLQTRSVLHRPGQKDSITFEPNNAVQLDISPAHITSITEALVHLTVPDVISDMVERGGGRVSATKQVWVERWPPVLVCHIKRFAYVEGKGIVKNGKAIEYGEELEVPDAVRTPSQRGNDKVRYRLFAAVYHHGFSALGGHYTVSLRQRLTGTWVHMDDTHIRATSAADVAVDAARAAKANARTGGSGAWEGEDKTAYLLFYERIAKGTR